MPILNISDNIEYQNILKDNIYIIIIFSAGFCKPCSEIYPYMLELSDIYNNIKFIKVDINNIVTIPHFKFMKNNREIFSFSGANRPTIIETINKLLNE
jgi:thiol-disulfide isomerase/thioredoxin